MDKIRVLIVDDSAVMRCLIKEALSRSPKIEVIGTAIDAYFAAAKIKSYDPDVITLDIEMPRMDGLTFLSKLMISNPTPVVMVSSLAAEGAKETLRALELGAVDFLLKPDPDIKDSVKIFSQELIRKVIGARGAAVKRISPDLTGGLDDLFVTQGAPTKKGELNPIRSDHIIAIGSSTGGTIVLTDIFRKLSDDLPPVLIVQHMPSGFTKMFAERLNTISMVYVKEAEHGDRLSRRCAYLAPAGMQMKVEERGGSFRIILTDDPPVNRFKPSVDVLFDSVCVAAGGNSTAVILTGMGSDGAKAMLELRKKGAATIAQDSESSVVFGMPKEAIVRGAAAMVKSIEGIAQYLNTLQIK